jgi:hypothetical protein
MLRTKPMCNVCPFGDYIWLENQAYSTFKDGFCVSNFAKGIRRKSPECAVVMKERMQSFYWLWATPSRPKEAKVY